MGHSVGNKQKECLRLTAEYFHYGTLTVPHDDSIIGTHEKKGGLKDATHESNPAQVHFARPSHYLFQLQNNFRVSVKCCLKW